MKKQDTSSTSLKVDCAVIGAGPAGISAAMEVMRLGLSVAIYERKTPGGQVTAANWISNLKEYPDGISGRDLAEKFKKDAAEKKINIIPENVLKVNFNDASFHIATNTSDYIASTVIVACGAYPLKLGIEVEERLSGRKLFYYVDPETVSHEGKKVLVIGSGDAAFDQAINFSKKARGVIIAMRGNTPKCAAHLLNEVLERRIEIQTGMTPYSFNDTADGVSANFKTSEGSLKINADIIVVCTGKEAKFPFLSQQMIDSPPRGLFFAGDCTGRRDRYIDIARDDGKKAAHNAARMLNMQVISRQGDPDIAEVFVARFRKDDRLLAEFVDARDPELPKDKKWVIIVSTQFGCPIACPMCDAGGDFYGNLTADEIFAQIDHAISLYPRTRLSCVDKFKVQFARMGEPALNPAVLDVLCNLQLRYNAPGLIPCIATTAPLSARPWFKRLLKIRREHYSGRKFQLQLSVNSTDDTSRDRLMPAPKISLAELGEYADAFYENGPRKVGINFALTKDVPVDPEIIARHFNPASTIVKLTPLNPTSRSIEEGFETALPPENSTAADALCKELQSHGFDVIVSIGDVRENQIGSNCGMAVNRYKGTHTS